MEVDMLEYSLMKLVIMSYILILESQKGKTMLSLLYRFIELDFLVHWVLGN